MPSRLVILLVVAAVLSCASAFSPLNSLLSHTKKAASASPAANTRPTSTTLFYRDDIPPIGSSQKWETPNDFQQFLTQCSMQSFMFLCHSLRDDQTVRWLHEFTEPVLQSNLNATAAGIRPKKETPPKVSLQQAANKALADMQLELMAAGTTGAGGKAGESSGAKEVKKSKQNPSRASGVPAQPLKEFRVRASPVVSPYSSKANKSTLKASTKKDLKAKAKTQKTAFSSFSRKATTLSLSLQETDQQPETNTRTESDTTAATRTPWAPTQLKNSQTSASSNCSTMRANTDISALYGGGSSIPTKKKTDNPGVSNKVEEENNKMSSKPSQSSKNGQKTSTTSAAVNTDVSALYGGGGTSIPTKKAVSSSKDETKQETPAKSFSPFGKKFATTSSTSSLYKAPEPKLRQHDSNDDDYDDSGYSSNSKNKYKTLPGLKYHGLAMFNRTKFPNWESYFEQLLEQPKMTYLIESNHKHVPSYEFDIDPASMCSRMLSVRKQIAQEFEHDLTVIAQMGGHTLTGYWKMLQDQRSERKKKKRQQKELEDQGPQSLEQSISKNGGAKNKEDETFKNTPYVHRANLLFLDSSVSEDNNNNGAAPSPLRKGNFDLLTLLTTQEAIHRVLNDPQRQARKSAEHGSNQFLQEFYITRLLSHFSGDQPYGRADDFMEELLECSPRMITVGSDNNKNKNAEEEDLDGIGSITSSKDDNKDAKKDDEDRLTKDLTYLIDPIGIAETILNKREEVALEWKQQLGEQTKADHMAIQKMVLGKLMGTNADECKVSRDGDIDESCFE